MDRVRSIIYGPPDQMAAFVMRHRMAGNVALASDDVREFQFDILNGSGIEPNVVAFLELKGEFRGWGTAWSGKNEPIEEGWSILVADIDQYDMGLGAPDHTSKLQYETMVIDDENDSTSRDTSSDHDGWLGIRTEIVDGFDGRDKGGSDGLPE